MIRLNLRKGYALLTVYLLMSGLMALTAAFFMGITREVKVSLVHERQLKAAYNAYSGIEYASQVLYRAFGNYFYSPTGAWSVNSFTWFDGLTTASSPVTLPITYTFDNGSFSVAVINVKIPPDGEGRDIHLRATGLFEGERAVVDAIVRFGLAPSRVFNYVYFINNYAWFWGNTIHINGDIRSNGNVSLKYEPTLNGDAYASVNPELSAEGTISGGFKSQDLSTYWDTAVDFARPTSPSAIEDVNNNGVLDPGEDLNGNGVIDDFVCPYGYTGSSKQYEKQEVLPMPYLGDLSFYKSMATVQGGKIKQSGSVIVDGVYTGHIILVGTEADPIEIEGSVVIDGDLVIKGYVKGQGTIYCGRNVHIVDNIFYKDRPTWSKPTIDVSAEEAANKQKDFLALAAKGNIVFGDYTLDEWNYVTNFIKPPFTQPYIVNETDTTNGYVSYYDAQGRPVFDGNYTAEDGGNKGDGTSRKFYESSFDDETFHNIAAAGSSIYNIDAFLYTNHGVVGRVGSLNLNGGIIARDEAIIYSGYLNFNYDPRIRTSGFDVALPRELGRPVVVALKLSKE